MINYIFVQFIDVSFIFIPLSFFSLFSFSSTNLASTLIEVEKSSSTSLVAAALSLWKTQSGKQEKNFHHFGIFQRMHVTFSSGLASHKYNEWNSGGPLKVGVGVWAS